MTGTLFATILSPILTIAVGFALLRHFSEKQPKDAKKTAKPRAPEYVTSEELEDALKKHREELEWEWTEMYDKFNKLHLRLTKRDQRKKRDQEELEDPQFELDERGGRPPSVLHFRKLGP